MTKPRTRLAALALGAFMIFSAPFAKAGEWDRETVFVTNAPIQIQGKVLEPGRHVLKLLDSASIRTIVQVYGSDGARLEMTVLGTTVYRPDPVYDTQLEFDDSSNGLEMPALRAWFYPGSIDGVAFRR